MFFFLFLEMFLAAMELGPYLCKDYKSKSMDPSIHGDRYTWREVDLSSRQLTES